MNYTLAKSKKANQATNLVKFLQMKFVDILQKVSGESPFKSQQWLRDEGIHGGGERYVPSDENFFNRASVNVSHVHYDDDPEKKLGSASALSSIIHPQNPYYPSIHIHMSYTEMKTGKGYWRIMADLNPSIENKEHTAIFNNALKRLSGEFFDEGIKNGNEYFFIPALETHRGVSHFYLEEFNTGDFEKDFELTKEIATGIIETYGEILNNAKTQFPDYSEIEKDIQRDYHTLYFYQVLTLDKGTVAGILVHNQNDLGILGSLPSKINGDLFSDWIDKTPEPFNELTKALSSIVGQGKSIPIEDEQKLQIAEAMRVFYKKHRELGTFRNQGHLKK
ncbi:MAG: coproporphyrinogen III oxidase [Crocinitomicaceae bacterium]|nr:coproporphyrinogen III oxidase [Crocinitomicaceae bacterium]